jgi:hypothetical protein
MLKRLLGINWGEGEKSEQNFRFETSLEDTTDIIPAVDMIVSQY